MVVHVPPFGGYVYRAPVAIYITARERLSPAISHGRGVSGGVHRAKAENPGELRVLPGDFSLLSMRGVHPLGSG